MNIYFFNQVLFKYYFPENKPALAVAVIKGIYENHNISGIVRFKQEVNLNFIYSYFKQLIYCIFQNRPHQVL